MKAKRGFSREKAYKSRVEFMQHWGLYYLTYAPKVHKTLCFKIRDIDI